MVPESIPSNAGSGIQVFLNAFEPNAPITQSPHDFNYPVGYAHLW
jgi:hypothetical protein